MHQLNDAARQAARQRALQEKQQQELEQPVAQARHQQRQVGSATQSSAYLQRLHGRQPSRREGVQGLPEWARAARPLPPLLPLQTKQQQEQPGEPRQPTPASSGAGVVGAAWPYSAAAQPLEEGEHLQRRPSHEEEEQLQVSLAALDARMAQRGEGSDGGAAAAALVCIS